ncbi:DUF1120 domain-containing protein [Pseudomonas sp. GZD-222]|uniref:DUF1120 domain-containing protein n=1 Tax=Pseudomonas sp. GZD-222 TaxID=3404805 RepID=UPI003BB5498A
MKFSRVTLVGCLAFSAAAQAAESIELTITGVIVPAACNPTLSKASLDFGTIPASDLTLSKNPLDPKPVTLTLTCDASASVAIKTADNRAGNTVTGTTAVYGFELATGNKKIGEYSIKAVSGNGDGTDRDVIVSSATTGPWVSVTAGNDSLDTSKFYALAPATGLDAPGSYTTQTFNFNVTPTIEQASTLPLTSSIKLDGSVTFEVVYL